ncbi:MAG: DUF1801 domain-containing protein [Sphingobacteriaceae bacterium]|nr:DUF1801 domain-containing protein [Cytophagaceae bacterium]
MEIIAKPTTVDEYIAAQPEPLRSTLHQLRKLIKNAASDAQEVISYGMPAYKVHGMLAYFNAHTRHYGLYLMPPVLQVFKAKLIGYELAKSTIRFPFNQPLPEALITEIIRYAANENLAKKAVKDAAKGAKANH